jgi:SH3-like domain-containing protein
MVDRVDVHSTPSTEGTVLFQLHEGARACILDARNGWKEIQLDNGNVGWVSDEATEDV